MTAQTDPVSPALDERDALIAEILEGLRRTLVHYGLWYREVEHQLGPEQATRIEAEAGDRAIAIILKRLAELLGFELEDGVPKALREKSVEELKALQRGVAVNWLANDGVWFQAVENRHGMDCAKRANDTCWAYFSPYEARRIKNELGLGENSGLEGLKAALGRRMYAHINRQSLEDVDERTVIFRMNECRVQSARHRKGLADYPCKSGGTVEYPTFAATIDPRIETECLGCPPDPHPEEWLCAWKFTLKP
jgi:hypothetical protein